MKILTLNFLTCAIKSCKSSPKSFPLHPREATLLRTEIDFSPLFMTNILGRIDWDALRGICAELGVEGMLPEAGFFQDLEAEGEGDEDERMMGEDNAGEKATRKEIPEETLRKLHNLLLETSVNEGKLVCGNCGFEYPVKEGVANFLLPAHLV